MYRFEPRRKISIWERFVNLSAVGMLIIVTTIISVIGFLMWIIVPESINHFALKPDNILAGKYLWTLVVHMFSHGGPLHLFVNMFVLFSLGALCEKIIGRRRFLWIYIVSGIAAGVLSVISAGFFGEGEWVKVFGDGDQYMVGASGAIFALAGLLMMLLPKLRFGIIFIPFFSLPAYIMVPVVLFLTWLISIIAGWNIGNVAHFGGFLVGIIYGAYLRGKYRRKLQILERHFR